MQLALVAAAVLVSSVWVACVNRHAPAPYMDEAFHVGQTGTYLAGNWTQWDPKITTPPGLYVVGVAWARGAEALGVPTHAGTATDAAADASLTGVLRGLGAVFYCVAVAVMGALLQRREGGTLRGAVAATTCGGGGGGGDVPATLPPPAPAALLSLYTFPFLVFFAGLYYTDVASVVAIAGALSALLSGRSFTAAMLGFWAVSLRQTNLVWVGVVYAIVILRDCGVETLAELVRGLPRLLFATLRHVGLVLIVAGCAAAGYINGGIVLGDKSNHEAVFHPTQLVYLTLIIAGFYPFACLSGVLAAVRNPRALAAAAAWTAFTVWCLRNHLITHPFTLADNRHYTFYIWKRLQLDQPTLRRYVLVPVSLFGACGAAHLLRRVRLSVQLLLFIASAATLVPSPLFEPRYYLTPVVLLLLCALASNTLCPRAAPVHVALHCVVNAATMALFLLRPFTAPDGSVGRFMW